MNEIPETRTTRGLAFICDDKGKVLRVVRDDFGVTENGTIDSMMELVERHNMDKARLFMQALNEQKATFGWELNIPLASRILTLVFNGAPVQEGFLVVAATSRSGVAKIADALVSINNEQTTALRSALKDLSLCQREQEEKDNELLDELSRLNNDLVNLQRDLARKNYELEKLNRLKDTFLAMASHDLRKPVGCILMNADLLLQSPSRFEKHEFALLRDVKVASQKVIRQLNDFLDVAQIETGHLRLELRSVNLGEIIHHKAPLYTALASPKQINVTCMVEEGIPALSLDAHRMEQVLDNLVENAIKYTPPGGNVFVSLQGKMGPVLLSVEDTGPGLNDEQVKSLFSPFATAGTKTTAGEKSTGLGLAISKAIVEQHGGLIECTKGSFGGARFIVQLPTRE